MAILLILLAMESWLNREEGPERRKMTALKKSLGRSMALLSVFFGLSSLCDFSATAQERTGILRGRVELKNPVVTDSRIISKDISAVYQKTATLEPSSHEPLSFVVYLEDAPELAEKPASNAATHRLVMDQKELTFVPHVLPILVGSKVEFPNSDPVYHNVFSFSKTKNFDLGRYPTGHSKTVTFNKPGLVKVYCDMHSQMNAFILVLANPYFTLTDEHGNYSIRDIPAGTYKVKAWFARLPEKMMSITIRAGETATLDFEFP
jgi:plastocyanin